MFINSISEGVNSDGFHYENRLINLYTVTSIGRSEVNSVDNNIKWFTIKFGHNKGHINEWFFNNKPERDAQYNIILKKLNLDDSPVIGDIPSGKEGYV